MTIQILASLVGLTLVAFCVGVYAAFMQRTVLQNWATSAVSLLSATVQWFGGAKHWIVFMLYAIAAIQAAVAIRYQLRRR